MGFKYVLVPASSNENIEELQYEDDIEDLTKDTFREWIEKYFTGLNTQSVDKSVLIKQLQERTGVDLQDKMDAGMDMDRLLTATSVEIFPVLLPTKDTGFHAISVYCDDKGIAKNLEENPRMSGLIQACGYVGQTFRGDCFIGRVFDDTQEEWRRMDFSLKDLSTDADWVTSTKRQRSNRSVGDMSTMANMAGVKNAAHINPAMLQDSAPTGETEQYGWRQAGDEVEVTFKKEGLQKGDKKDVKVTFGRNRLKVVVKGETMVDAELFAATQADENTWTLSDGVLQVTLTKEEDESWSRLLKSE